ncbi:MAG: Nif3-like dinuclear metal center hexameric protein [Flavobacteriaceae bacterium]|nr:Nif3-like dinuclear metal center hexameric protein [Flavobacteriaceae bacterium]NNL79289.1 Nif3-like dinuclear metal center hexameric protein [Flavobacteriaceae bacterium]
MTVRDVIRELDSIAPLAYAEDFDNVGLLVGNPQQEVTGILVTLDTLESVVDEAIDKDCNCIVSFHPIIFKGLKKITGSNYVEKAVMRAIRNDVAILCIHTALDNALEGVNDRICEQLDLLNRKILIPKEETIRKLTTYVPAEKHENVRKALFEAGAGEIGKYSNCSFNIDGTGTFKGDDTSTPSYGEKGVFHSEKEINLTLTFQKHLESGILKALFEAHPYEEVAFEVITLNNANQTIGMGMIGDLKTPMNEQDFLNFVKTRMNTSLIRHSALNKKTIKKVAVLGGSGSFAISSAQNAGADAYITADLKYHDFFQANESLLLMDIGHYESEQYTKSLLVQNLKKKMPNFAVILSDINTNPVKYF